MKLLVNLLKRSELQYEQGEWKLNSGEMELVYRGKPSTGITRIL